MRKVALVSMVLAVGACASTSTKTEWKSPDLKSQAVSKVLVVGLMPDEGKRRMIEDSMVAALVSKGVQAEQSYKSLPGQQLQKDAVTQLVQSGGFDSALVTRFAGVHDEIVANGAAFDPYWGAAYPLAYGYPTTYTTQTTVILDSRLFAKNGNMLWSGASQSFDPNQLSKESTSVANSVTGTLKQQGALASNPATHG